MNVVYFPTTSAEKSSNYYLSEHYMTYVHVIYTHVVYSIYVNYFYIYPIFIPLIILMRNILFHILWSNLETDKLHSFTVSG